MRQLIGASDLEAPLRTPLRQDRPGVQQERQALLGVNAAEEENGAGLVTRHLHIGQIRKKDAVRDDMDGPPKAEDTDIVALRLRRGVKGGHPLQHPAES